MVFCLSQRDTEALEESNWPKGDPRAAHVRSITLSSESCWDQISYLWSTAALIIGNLCLKGQAAPGPTATCGIAAGFIMYGLVLNRELKEILPRNGHDGVLLTPQSWLLCAQRKSAESNFLSSLSVSLLDPCLQGLLEARVLRIFLFSKIRWARESICRA